jgi:glutathione S-transferase
MLKIWGRVTSSNVQKVLWLADELGLACERIDAGGPAGRVNDPDYRALNPNGLVPTIEDDDFVLWESNTILRYLAAKHRAEGFYPADLRRRADVERWMDWGSTMLAPAIFPAFWGMIRTPAAERDHAAIGASVAKTAGALSILDAQLRTRPYLCGEAPTLADVVTGVNAYRWFNIDFSPAGASRPEMPALRLWYERLAQRPAYQARVMIPIR